MVEERFEPKFVGSQVYAYISFSLSPALLSFHAPFSFSLSFPLLPFFSSFLLPFLLPSFFPLEYGGGSVQPPGPQPALPGLSAPQMAFFFFFSFTGASQAVIVLSVLAHHLPPCPTLAPSAPFPCLFLASRRAPWL